MKRAIEKVASRGNSVQTRLIAFITLLQCLLIGTALTSCPATDYLLVAGHETKNYDNPVVAFRNNFQEFLLA